MKQFLAMYLGPPDAMSDWSRMEEKKRKELEAKGITAWKDWVKKHHAAIVTAGGPLGKTKRVTRSGISDTRNNMGAFIVVTAESQDAAARMFEQHPHFMIFPGEAVEIMEVLPIPPDP
jgi:hypothetical protein